MRYDYELDSNSAWGWIAKTRIVLGPATNSNGEEGQRVLRIRTAKHENKQIITNATVAIEADGWETFTPRKDFSKHLQSLPGPATKNAVVAAHLKALTNLEALKAAATAWYEPVTA